MLLAAPLAWNTIACTESRGEPPVDGGTGSELPDVDATADGAGSPSWIDVEPGETAEDYWRVPIPDAESRGAVCNDGSPFVAYVRPGRGDADDRWILFLKGGGACGSVDACNARFDVSPNLMRAPAPSWRPSSNGIFNPDPAENPDWAEWTHVYLYYCSSDVWGGDREASDESGGWHFRGHRILETVLSDFQSPPDGLPDLSEATDVMLMGSSAGSVGVQHNLDFVAETLPWADVVGVIDSAWNPGIPYDVDSPPERDGDPAAEYTELMNFQADASCLDDEADPAQCLQATYVAINHVSTPYFVFMDQYDGVVLSRGGVTSFCVSRECETSAECGEGDSCFEGLCAGPSCEMNADCDGTCHEQGACYADSCDSNADCAAEQACMQGFCIDTASTLCDEHSECGPGGTCVGGVCFVSQTCTTTAECGVGETCNRQTYRCMPDIECGGASDCSAGEVCLPRRQTPTVQDFGRSVRDLMAPLEGAFGTQGGFHTMLQSDTFLTRRVRGVSYAETLGNWYFERSGATHVVAWE